MESELKVEEQIEAILALPGRPRLLMERTANRPGGYTVVLVIQEEKCRNNEECSYSATGVDLGTALIQVLMDRHNVHGKWADANRAESRKLLEALTEQKELIARFGD